MRLSGLSLATFLLLSCYTFAQHSSGGSSSSSSSSSGGSSGGGSHSSSSSGSGYSGGSHSSGGGYSSSGGSHSSGGSQVAGAGHSWGGGHSANVHSGSGSSHASGGASISNARGNVEHGTSLVKSHSGIESSAAKVNQRIREPKPGTPERVVVHEKRSFFSFLRHPFRKPPPKREPRPALYLPRPVCPKGRCVPACPVGQVSSGGACVTPRMSRCMPGQIWNLNTMSCGYSTYECSQGEIWNGGTCLYHTRFLDSCLGLRTSMERQTQRVQAVESARRSACASGPAQECSQATAAWQSEENLRQNLLARYRQCLVQSMPTYSSQYGISPYDSMLWFDSLRFNADF